MLRSFAAQRGGIALRLVGGTAQAVNIAAMNAAPGSAAPADEDPPAALPARQPCPSDALFTTLYGELHRLARREAARAGPAPIVSATTLLHEAYLDMAQRSTLEFPDRAKPGCCSARARAVSERFDEGSGR